jgi:gamma-glutamyltranspeptidase/glutathione hydrolase
MIRPARLIGFLFLTIAACASPEAKDPAAASAPARSAARVTSPRGMVVSDDARASEIGAEVLRKGGNAVDAAVATAFALAVTFPQAGNIGGGGFLVCRIGSQEYALDFRETAPAAATRDMFLGADGRPDDRARTGALAVGVPGSVAGLFEAHRKLGSRPWPELLAPSIALAGGGFLVSEPLAHEIEVDGKRLRKFPATAALYMPGGAPLRESQLWKNPDLARALRRISAEGPAGFYSGETAALLVSEMERDGGRITAADLANYRPVWREPFVFEYRGRRVVSMPPPSSGGITLAMICNILGNDDLPRLGRETTETIHLRIEAMRRAFAARNAFLGDPDFVKNPIAELASADWAKRERTSIDTAHATPSEKVGVRVGDDAAHGTHTTHLCVTDAAGNAVALTTTINDSFGSAVVVAGAGFLLNNEMDDFTAKPGSPNSAGLLQSEANAIAPGKRMLSSMTPTIVIGPDGKVVLVAGAAGGPTIISSIFGILSGVVDFGLPADEAVRAARVHHQHYPDEVRMEGGLLGKLSRNRLTNMGHHISIVAPMADATAIGRDGDLWVGAADPRRGGAARGE